MSYANFKALVKKVNLKPKGVQEIVLEVSGDELKGQLEYLASMVDNHAQVELESMIVNYNVTVNAATREPLIEYKVDEQGVVQEVKKPKQLELEGLPKEKIETEEETVQLEREAIDQFILNDMAPEYDDFPKNFSSIVKRRLEGESYSRLANELDMNSGKIVEEIDAYRKRIAPLAQKWWEWKQDQETEKNEDASENKEDNERNDEGAA